MFIFLPYLLNLPGNRLGSPKLDLLDLGPDYEFIALFEISICVQKFFDRQDKYDNYIHHQEFIYCHHCHRLFCRFDRCQQHERSEHPVAVQ